MIYGAGIFLGTLLVVHFDGSLRKPSDPGFSVTDLASMSSCAVGIQQSDDGHKPSSLCAMGGKLVQVTSSAEAEYEGLLMGLEMLSSPRSPWWHPSKSTPSTVLIMGDCKTVIQQMNGRSRPRKLQHYVDRCQALLETLPVHVEFRHVPRDQNVLADSLCQIIFQENVRKAMVDFTAALEDWQGGSEVGTGILKRFLSFPSSLVPYSRRPRLYQQIAQKAVKLQAWHVLQDLGQRLDRDNSLVWTKSDSSEAHVIQELTIQALVYKQLALEGLGRVNEVEVLWRKVRHLKQRWAFYAEEWRTEVLQQSYSSDTVYELLTDDLIELSPPYFSAWLDQYRRELAVADAWEDTLRPCWWFQDEI